MKHLLITGITMICFLGNSQENYDSKPWKVSEKTKIKISTKGKVVEFPQYLSTVNLTEPKIKDSIIKSIVIVDEKGNSVKPNYFYTVQHKELVDRLKRAANPNKNDSISLDIELKKIDLTMSAADYLIYTRTLLSDLKLDCTSIYAQFFPTDLKERIKKKQEEKVEKENEEKVEKKNKEKIKKEKQEEFSYTIPADSMKIDEKLVKFEVYVINKNAPILEAWLQKLVDSMKQEIESISKLQQELFNYYDDNEESINAVSSICSRKDSVEIGKTNEILTKLTLKIKEIQDLKAKMASKWRISWFWYSGSLKEDPWELKPSEHTTKKIDSLNARIKSLELLMTAGALGSDKDYDNYNQIGTQYATVVAEKKKTEDGLKDYQAALLKKKWENEMFFLDTIKLYSGIIYVSTKGETNFTRSHDLTMEYDEMGVLRKEYYEDEKIHYLVHNTTGIPEKTKLEITGESIEKHAPDWVEETNSVFGELTNLMGTEGISEFLQELSNYGSQKDEASRIVETQNLSTSWQRQKNSIYIKQFKGRYGKKMFEAELKQKDSICLIWQEKANSVINNYNIVKNDDKVDSLLEKLNSYKRPTTNVCLSTIEMQPKSELVKLPATVSYSFNKYKNQTEKEESFAFNKAYKRYKYKYVQVYGGLNYSPGNYLQTLTISSEDDPLQPKLESNPLQFVAGVKFYPWGGEISENKIFQMTKHRLHINAALSIPKPLTNLYIGAGFDIYPGWDINFNLHLFRDNRYTIENGTIIETQYFYRPAFSIGTGIDASVFANVIKFLF